uniref:Uncharacterized protein n=1 Tax=Pyrodinium bahamense TaxID=73915 RepID=A0A7S0FQM0_9DINO
MADMALLPQAALDSVAQEVPYQGLWGLLRTFPKRKPFATNLALSTSVAVVADYAVQRMEGRGWDKKRSCLFFAFGLINGAALWWIYITVFGRIFPSAIRFANKSWAEKVRDLPGQLDVVKQSMCDLLVYAPLGYFPLFYLFKAIIQDEGSPTECVVHASLHYRQNALQDVTRSLICWVPGNILCFSVPAWLRLPLTHAWCFGWNMVMSWSRAGSRARTDSLQMPAGLCA